MMIEIKVIRICNEISGLIKTCFVEGDNLVFETERSLRDKHNEALAFEMGLSKGLDGQNFSFQRINMSQKEFDALKLKESPWCGIGPRTLRKKKQNN